MTYALRFLPTDPYGRGGFTNPGTFATHAAADEVRRAMPNGAHVEVVESDPDG